MLHAVSNALVDVKLLHIPFSRLKKGEIRSLFLELDHGRSTSLLLQQLEHSSTANERTSDIDDDEFSISSSCSQKSPSRKKHADRNSFWDFSRWSILSAYMGLLRDAHTIMLCYDRPTRRSLCI